MSEIVGPAEKVYIQQLHAEIDRLRGHTGRDDAIALLRAAGCTDPSPLLGERPGVGPRCRLCNTVAPWPSTQSAKEAQA